MNCDSLINAQPRSTSSPFAKNFIEALQSQGGRDGVLTIAEVYGFVEKLKNPPRLGDFGDSMPGSDFVFIRK